MGIDAWARLDVTTINKHLPGMTEVIYKKHPLFAWLKEKKRFVYNCSGKKFDWRIKYRMNSLQGYDDMMPVSFPRFNRYASAELPYRAYSQSEAISKFEELANKGSDTQLIDLVVDTTKSLAEDAAQQFPAKLWLDGTANPRDIHGVESWMSVSGASAGNKVSLPNDSYAGHLTTMGSAFGGSWTGTFPAGTGTPEYTAWSPLVVNVKDTGWAATTKTWPNTCREALRFGILFMEEQMFPLDMILMTRDMYSDLLAGIEGKESVEITRGAASSTSIKLGFDAINYMGVDIMQGYGVPTDCAYGFVADQLELRSMQPQLFQVDKDSSIDNKTKKLSLDFFGNLKISTPKASCKWYGA